MVVANFKSINEKFNDVTDLVRTTPPNLVPTYDLLVMPADAPIFNSQPSGSLSLAIGRYASAFKASSALHFRRQKITMNSVGNFAHLVTYLLMANRRSLYSLQFIRGPVFKRSKRFLISVVSRSAAFRTLVIQDRDGLRAIDDGLLKHIACLVQALNTNDRICTKRFLVRRS
jgi:hypothetical protein